MIMDRIKGFAFPDEYAGDADPLILRLANEGTFITLDGWSPRVKGKSQPPEVMAQVKAQRLSIIFRLITLCPHPCESCEGWAENVWLEESGIAGLQNMHYFCTAHIPNTEITSALWDLAKLYKKQALACREFLDLGRMEDYRVILEKTLITQNALADLYRQVEPRYPETL